MDTYSDEFKWAIEWLDALTAERDRYKQALAAVPRYAVFGSQIRAECVFCRQSHERHANDIAHTEGCLVDVWKEAQA